MYTLTSVLPSKFKRELTRSALFLVLVARGAAAQSTTSANAGMTPDPKDLVREADQLTRALDAAQLRIANEQQEVDSLRRQLAALRAALPGAATEETAPAKAVQVTPPPQATEEQVQMTQSQIATLDQEKVESASKFPVRIRGTLLINGFVNTGHVDDPAAPSSAFGGSGSTGLSLRQTALGLDANGPHVFGARTSGDVEVDFFGASSASGYDNAGGLLRLRTAHTTLDWRTTRVYFEYDKPLISPYTPQSLLAAAVPELAWSGNLWSWNPQAGISHDWGASTRFRAQAALIDPANPVFGFSTMAVSGQSGVVAPSASELSRRPGVEARLSILNSDDETGFAIGAGGYFSPHSFDLAGVGKGSFDAWATTLDLRTPLGHGLSFTATAYRGQGLGGLGGGGYRDYVYRGSGGEFVYRALDDVGGWIQLHHSINQKFAWNMGVGIDNPFAGALRTYVSNDLGNSYGNIARNRTGFANVLFSPRAYLIFSAEYRNFRTAPVQGPLWTSNVTGLGAAYRF